MLAVSSQTFEDRCRMAKRNSLGSVTLRWNLFLGFIIRLLFPPFFFKKGKKIKNPSFPSSFRCLHMLSFLPFKLLSHAASFIHTHLLFVQRKADYPFQRSNSSKKRCSQVTMQIPWKTSLMVLDEYAVKRFLEIHFSNICLLDETKNFFSKKLQLLVCCWSFVNKVKNFIIPYWHKKKTFIIESFCFMRYQKKLQTACCLKVV